MQQQEQKALLDETAEKAINTIETQLEAITEAVKSPRVNKEKVLLAIERCKPAVGNLRVLHIRGDGGLPGLAQ